MDAAALNSEGVVTLVIDVGACVGTVVGFTDIVGAGTGTYVGTMVGLMDSVGEEVGADVGTVVGITDVVGDSEGDSEAVKLAVPK